MGRAEHPDYTSRGEELIPINALPTELADHVSPIKPSDNTGMNRMLLIVVLGLISLPLLAAQNLKIDDAWSPQAPPGRMMAGFLTITNPGTEDVILVDAESPQFGHVELHTMIMDDGVMRMRRLNELVIPAGEQVELKPGGLHLMLIEPKGTFELGEQLEVTLIGADDSRITLQSEVRPRPGMRAH